MDDALTRSVRRRIYGCETRIREDLAPARAPSVDTSLVRHIFRTQASLRGMIGWVAFAYPFLLLGIGYFIFGLEMPNSISDFYWHPYRPYRIDAAIDGGYLVADATVRVFFAGGLYAIGVFLIGYRGYSKGENRLHTLAGLCAIAVATFPMNPCQDGEPVCAIRHLGNILYGHDLIHFVSAALLFVFLGMAIFCYSKNTLQYFGNARWQGNLQWIYYGLGGYIWVVPIVVYLAFHSDTFHTKIY